MITAFIILAIVCSSSSQSILDMMTPEELVQIFGTSFANEVPEYDTVPIVAKSLNKSNGMYITLKRFGENLKMWLTPKNGILVGEDMPIFSLKTNKQNRIDITKYSGLLKEALPKLYENTLHAATFAVSNHREGKMSLTGFFGNSYVQPVPSRLVEHAKRQARAVDNSFNHEEDDYIYHFVHTISNSRIKRQANVQLQSRPASNAQEIIYPEILVIADYDLIVKFNGKVKEAILYILSFWNGVDMRWRSIEHPRVRLNIAGIVFSQDSKALPYLISQNGKIKSTSDSLDGKGKFLYLMKNLTPIDSYDIAVTMTSNSLCEDNNCDILGQVRNIGKACDVDHQRKSMERVLIMRDRGGFDGIETASHELGHLLGMHHDGSVNTKCPDELGYIMATSNRFSKYAFDWSKCSLGDMQTFLRTPEASCLFNKPNQGKPINRFLPGQLMSPHEQCRMINGLRASKIDDSICTQLRCKFPDNDVSKFTDLIPEAAEGSTCGIGKICLHGNCVFKTQIYK